MGLPPGFREVSPGFVVPVKPVLYSSIELKLQVVGVDAALELLGAVSEFIGDFDRGVFTAGYPVVEYPLDFGWARRKLDETFVAVAVPEREVGDYEVEYRGSGNGRDLGLERKLTLLRTSPAVVGPRLNNPDDLFHVELDCDAPPHMELFEFWALLGDVFRYLARNFKLVRATMTPEPFTWSWWYEQQKPRRIGGPAVPSYHWMNSVRAEFLPRLRPQEGVEIEETPVGNVVVSMGDRAFHSLERRNAMLLTLEDVLAPLRAEPVWPAILRLRESRFKDPMVTSFLFAEQHEGFELPEGFFDVEWDEPIRKPPASGAMRGL